MKRSNFKAVAAATAAMTLWIAPEIRADEGMWLPALISERIGDMQEKGFKLTAEDIYSLNQASLKDAVVLFGRGCTGEIISSEGLLITNHHCGYGQIQKHSSMEHDYLKDGFWAMDRKEELPNEGLTVSFLERMEDVTDLILKGYAEGMEESQRDSIVRMNSDILKKEATAGDKNLRATVESMYYGNQYFLFLYKEYSDVRLVGAPPSSIGKFGGDTDNWIWPRHTGDFSLFRIYADKDNNPAPYSEENVPYRPEKYFKISLDGVKENDFTFVYGFPGSTREYIMSEGVRYIAETADPAFIDIRTKRLDIQKRHMEESSDIRIRYSSKNAGVANAWKKWQGEMRGIERRGTVGSKREYERRFARFAKGTKYEKVLPGLDSLYKAFAPYTFTYSYYRETAYTVELSRFALQIGKILKGENEEAVSEAVKSAAESFYKDYYLPIDKESFVAVMHGFESNIPERFIPEYFKNMKDEYGSTEAWADNLFSTSIFADKEKALSITKADSLSVYNDPAYIFGTSFEKWISEEIYPEVSRLSMEISLLNRDYMKGQMEFEPEKAFYPDANLTLRVAYGKVRGYSPSDGICYKPYSTIEGIMEKDNPKIFDYDIPQKLREIHASKDYGRWAIKDENGIPTIPVCFIADNHTSGGNSGSPVINADGNLIGINFDRVWEGTMSDIEFDPEYCRNISLDIRYALFVIDRLAGAHHLIEEMEFAE